MQWKTTRRTLNLDRPLVMGILNLTPDSFSDGGELADTDAALTRAGSMIADGASILDVGGESTRPGSRRVEESDEISRVIPVIEQIAKRYDVPISIDTTKVAVASAALDSGAEIVNDISGLRWDPSLADIVAPTGAGLILMHSRGNFETMHSEPPVDDILDEVATSLRRSIDTAKGRGVADEQIAVDIGIGFGKTFEQNIELLAKLDLIAREFAEYPVVVGTSRKSFIGKILGGVPADQRLGGSIATAILAARKGARILRVHDVKETVAELKVFSALQ